MVGTLAQLIALVAHGNASLNVGYEGSDFYPFNSTFQFCNEVSFVDVKKLFKVKEIEIARTPNHWFTFLKDNNCRRLSLGYSPTRNPRSPDYKLAGFVGGGGTWHIASSFSSYADYWLGRWQVTNQKARDNKIWKVTYGRVAAKEKLPKLQTNSLSTYRDKLEHVLKQIEAFALRHNLEFWADYFRKGLEAMTSTAPINQTYHKDLLPNTGYSLEAKQLIAAAGQAWVFGGMGSWNDLSFDDMTENKEYERLSEELYAAINLCVEESVNSYSAS